MSAFIAKAETALEELEGYGMLEGYAAHAAALVLVESWRAATHDGAQPDKLIPDIDHTIEQLQAFKALIGK